MADSGWKADKDFTPQNVCLWPLADLIGQGSVVRVDGTIYVIDNVCTHTYALRSDGFVDGCTIECPLHQAKFVIRTGRCLGPPADDDLRIYSIKIGGDDVLAAATAN
jgi:nitrite reductase/ring-hydroxylating ferredoxin subunit